MHKTEILFFCSVHIQLSCPVSFHLSYVGSALSLVWTRKDSGNSSLTTFNQEYSTGPFSQVQVKLKINLLRSIRWLVLLYLELRIKFTVCTQME